MSERHALAYLASRVASALVNAAAVAVFTRISTPELYGQYLVGFALCFIIYGLGVQWVAFAHFGNYRPSSADRLAGSLLVISGAAVLPATALIGALGWAGALDPDVAIGSAILLVCFTVFFAAVEIGRTHLLVGTVTIATLVRSVGSLLFGIGGLWLFQSPAALLAGVGVGYGLGAVPVILRLRHSIWAQGFVWPARQEIWAMLRYGWPLIFAFGTSAAAVNVDRIFLERFFDAAAVAPYGAILDLMKQTFLVVAEAISVAYISTAKTLHVEGSGGAARDLLARAFVTQCFIIVFGVAFFLLLGDTLFAILLPPGYVEEGLHLLPLLLLANAILVLRSYYFGQVIYLHGSAKLEMVSSGLMLAVVVLAGYLLIPRFGAEGAAVAFTLSQAFGLMVYLLATPPAERLPVNRWRTLLLVLAGSAVVTLGMGSGRVLGPPAADLFNLMLLTLVSGFFLLRWNLFDARLTLQRLLERWRQAPGGP